MISLVFRKWPGCARDSTAIFSTVNWEGNQEGMSEISVKWMVGFFHLLLLLIKLVGMIANCKNDVYSDDLISAVFYNFIVFNYGKFYFVEK